MRPADPTTGCKAIGHLEGRHIGSQGAGGQRSRGPGWRVGQYPGDVGDVCIGNGVVHQGLQIGRLADAHRGQTARALSVVSA